MLHHAFGWIAGLAFAGNVLAQAPDNLDLAFKISIDGRLVGEPRLVVAPGVPAQSAVRGGGGGDYRLDVRADPVAGADPASVVIAATLYDFVDGTWRQVAEPTLQVALDGRPASIRVGDPERNAARYAIEVSATPVPAIPSKANPDDDAGR